MKTGKTRVDVQASFGWRDEFTIPAGTVVQYGARAIEETRPDLYAIA